MAVEGDDLPDGWVSRPLGEVAKPTKTKVDPNLTPTTPYVGLEHVDPHSMRLLGQGVASDVRSAKTKFTAGDVLYGKLRPYLNKVVQPTFSGISSTDFLVFGESEHVDNGYLAYFLNQLTVADYAHHVSTGVELPRVNWEALASLPIAFPVSKREQRRVVEAIDLARDGVSSVESGVLSTVRSLHNMKRSIHMAACSGRLTEAWRAANPDAPSVEEALGRVVGKKRRSKATSARIDLPLPELPGSYLIATLGQASTILEYGTSKKCGDDPRGVPVLRMGNLTDDGLLKIDDLKYAPKDAELERPMLEDGDLLFNRTNSAEKVGKSAVFHEGREMSFASYLIRVRLDTDVADPGFVNLWLNSAWGRLWARHVKTDGVSQSNINGTKLGDMPLPLPPIDEQREIVKRAIDLLGRVGEIETRIDAARLALERSAQAVLAKAFRGELLSAVDAP